MPPRTGEPTTDVRDRGPADRVVTIPNALSVLRLLGVPLFLWLLLGPHADLAALFVLMVAGATDYFDGKIARWLGQTSRLGVLLDPAADRLYILATLIAFVARDIIPWWLAALIVGRDVLLAPTLPVLRRHGYGPLAVSYVGKAATFNLLYAFPFLLIAAHDWPPSDACRPIGWAFVIWGTALYLYSAGLYLAQVVQVVRADRVPATTGADRPSGTGSGGGAGLAGGVGSDGGASSADGFSSGGDPGSGGGVGSGGGAEQGDAGERAPRGAG